VKKRDINLEPIEATTADSKPVVRTPYDDALVNIIDTILLTIIYPGARPPIFPPEYKLKLESAFNRALSSFTPLEQCFIKMRLSPYHKQYSRQQTADHMGISVHRVRELEKDVLHRLGQSATSVAALLKAVSKSSTEILHQRSSPQRLAELVPVIETIKRLEPSLIAHLQQNNDDLIKINPLLFEHLFAEFLAARGFDDVRLVGRNAKTSADIFAAKFIPGLDVPMRFFVEVKRWKNTIGIEVINQVLGAFLGERERFGWNAALVVTVGGFRDFEKWSREELALKGLFLKERDDLLRYLDGYKQHANGLWLPNPRTDL
jgi:hypothetical protein